MLTLARRLKCNEHEVFFVCRRLQGNLIDLVKSSFPVIELPAPDGVVSPVLHCSHGAWLEVDYDLEIQQSRRVISDYLSQNNRSKLDWLVIDHYAIEATWQRAMSFLTAHCLQIDDLADREHQVDILLDQNYYQRGSVRYNNLLPTSAIRLCGPKYALLRDEFATARQQLLPYESRFKERRVVLFFGGVDIANETSKALLGLLSIDSQDHFDVIIGINNPHREVLEKLCSMYPSRVSLHIQVINIVEFFSDAYLYVGAVGATTWERCVMALPGIVCSVADNQTQLAIDLSKINGHEYLGLNSELKEDDYAQAYQRLLTHPESLFIQSKICAQLVDGVGCQRVVARLEEISIYDEV